jgi:hypothetical protein
VKQHVLDDSLVRVKILNRDGTIVYSDEPRLIGTRDTRAADELAGLDTGVIQADTCRDVRPWLSEVHRSMLVWPTDARPCGGASATRCRGPEGGSR